MFLKDSIFSKTKKEAYWGDVYCLSNNCEDEKSLDRFKGLIERNKKIYDDQIKEYDLNSDDIFEDIETCVKCALKNANHALFAEYLIRYIERIKLDESSPKSVFFANIKDVVTKNGININRLVVFKETIGNYWRDSKYFCDAENKNVLLKEENLRKKLNGETANKDTVVQIGLQLGLNSKMVNKWLKLIGKSGLYILDLVDCFGIYYLNYYYRIDEERRSKDSNYCLSIEEGVERVAYVKRKINEYIDKLVQNGENLLKNGSTSQDIVLNLVEGKGLEFGSDVIKYIKDDHSWNIHQIISKLDKENEINREKKYDDLLTIHFAELFNADNENNFLAYVYDNLSVFLQVKYALYANVMICVEDVNSIKKNLLFYASSNNDNFESDCYLGNELFGKKEREIEKIKDIQDIIGSDYKEYPANVRNYIKNYNKNGYLKLNGYISLVTAVYGTSNCLEKTYLDNNRLSNNDLYYKTRGDGGKKERNLREFSKNDIVKLAVSTGHENDIGQLLLSGCYWDRDLINKDLSFEIINGDVVVDPLDIFILYAYSYRDSLIETWLNNSDKNYELLKKDYMKRFPMVALMGIISRDIQFVFGYVKSNNIFSMYYNDFQHSSVFRTIESEKKWYDSNKYPTERRGEKT